MQITLVLTELNSTQ